MWNEDRAGSEFGGNAEAMRALRDRARAAIAEGDQQGHDIRATRVRLRSEAGDVLFEGTLIEAATLTIDDEALRDGETTPAARGSDGPGRGDRPR